MALSRDLRMLYREVPAMACQPGCSACCGPAPWTAEEWARVAADRVGVPVETHDFGHGGVVAMRPGELRCPFASDQGCRVYDRRPFMCRLFGTADDPRLRCPKGCRPRTLMSAAKAAKLRARYIGDPP